MDYTNVLKVVRNKERNYTIISNTILRDDKISARAKGIYCYIMSLPENWKIYKSELHNHFTEGINAFNTAFKELEEKGYVSKKKIKSNGRFCGWQYTLYEEPNNISNLCDSDFTKKRKSETQHVEKQLLLNTDITNTDIPITNNNSLSKDKQRDFSNPNSFNKSFLNSIEYKLIIKYYNQVDNSMTIPSKNNDYKITKEIKQAVKKIKALLNGTFIEDYPYEKIDSKVKEILSRPLTLIELEELLEKSLKNYKIIHRGNYFPNNKDILKVNFNNFLYNDYFESSWFMYCLAEIKSNKQKSMSEMRKDINTNVINLYEGLFGNKINDNERYNIVYNVYQNMRYIKSYLSKVEKIYRYNNNYLNYFDGEMLFVQQHISYLKSYKDLKPGHLKLTGATGTDFAKWCRQKWNVIIDPTAEDLMRMEEETKKDKEWRERLKKNKKQNEDRLTEKDLRIIEAMIND